MSAAIVVTLIFTPVMWFVMGGPHSIVLVVTVWVLILCLRTSPGEAFYGTRIAVSGGLGALLAVWFIFEIFDPYPGSVLDRMILVKSRAFEVDLKISVDGEDVHLNRRIRCIHGRSLSTRSLFTSSFLYVGIDSFGQILKSGGAVIVVTPKICRGQNSKDPRITNAKKPSEWKFLPMIGWMDNAKQPTTTELYASSKLYKNPKSRVKIGSYSVRPISPWAFLDGSDDFEHFTMRKFGNTAPTPSSPKSYRYFNAYSIQAIGEDRWSQYKHLRELSKIKHTQLLSRPFVIGPAGKEFSPIDSNTVYFGNRSWPVDTTFAPKFWSRFKRRNPFTNVEPLRMTENELSLSRSESGVLVCYPTFKPGTNKKYCPTIKIRQASIFCQQNAFFGSNYIFDPKEKTLYRLSKITQAWPLAR